VIQLNHNSKITNTYNKPSVFFRVDFPRITYSPPLGSLSLVLCLWAPDPVSVSPGLTGCVCPWLTRCAQEGVQSQHVAPEHVAQTFV
jgi:hypothetical protein